MIRTIDELQDLTEPQLEVIKNVADDVELARTFYLTGGTLLKALGIVPRQSNDLDFFTYPEVDALVFNQRMIRLHRLAQELFGVDQIVDTDRGWMDKASGMVIDAVHDNISQIGSFVVFGTLATASLEDAAAGKASALCSRDEIKDYIDIAFLTKKQNWSLRNLAEIAEKKFRLGTIGEEKLLSELVAKREQFQLRPEMFLRDGITNIELVTAQIDKLINSTTL
jgi:hypothetical protein